MKKIIFVLAITFSFAVLLTACKETKKEEVKIESHEDHNHENEDTALRNLYQCPMNCEKGKTYDKAGSCPMCKMDLKLISGDNKEGVKHADGCKCKENGGECKCEPGKCQCIANVTYSDACKCKETGECKCEAGKCECKA